MVKSELLSLLLRYKQMQYLSHTAVTHVKAYGEYLLITKATISNKPVHITAGWKSKIIISETYWISIASAYIDITMKGVPI